MRALKNARPLTRTPRSRGVATTAGRAARLAVYIGFNVEHFAFGEGLGAALGPQSPEPDVLNYSWRDYGNRVGVWRCFELFDSLKLPVGALINTALYDYCPEVVEAYVKRGDELIGHGHTNSERQGKLSGSRRARAARVLQEHIQEESKAAPRGWLSPGSRRASSRPICCRRPATSTRSTGATTTSRSQLDTRAGTLWSIPYPQELNDIPMIVARQMDGRDFADMIVDNFDEMLRQSKDQPLVMGIALHPYLVGQPYRLSHLRRALQHIVKQKKAWLTTPGRILDTFRA